MNNNGKKISDLNQKAKLSGKELIPLAYDGSNYSTNINAISDYIKNINSEDHVVIQPDESLQDQFDTPNSIYEINEDIDLKNSTINIPANCELRFDKGVLKNGTVNGNNTTVNAPKRKIFDNDLQLTGTFTNTYLYAEHFGVSQNGDCTQSLQHAINVTKRSGIQKLILDSGAYYISDTVNIPSRFDFGGEPDDSLAAWKYSGQLCMIYQMSDKPMFSLGDDENGARLISIHDISLNIAPDQVNKLKNVDGLYSKETSNVTGCNFRNIFINGLHYGINLNVVNGGGITENSFINVALMRNVVGMCLNTSTTDNPAWFNHNYFRLCYINENTSGGVLVNGIKSVQTILFQSCNFENNGKNYSESDYAELGCFAFKASNMLYGNILFDSCYFENTYPRDVRNTLHSNFNTSREAHIIFGSGQLEVRNSIIARTRQFVTTVSGSVMLSNNEYYLNNKLNDTFSTSLVRYLKIHSGGKSTSLVVDEPTLGNVDTYINSAYIFDQSDLTSTNTFYQGNVKINAPLFEKEEINKGMYETDVTLYINQEIGNVNYTGLSKTHPLPNLSALRYYGNSRYANIKNWTFVLQTDLNDLFQAFSDTENIKNVDVTIKGNGNTIYIADKTNIYGRNVKLRFVNCKIVINNETAHYNILYLNGRNEVVFDNCEIIFNKGLSTSLLNCGNDSTLHCGFYNSSAYSLETPQQIMLIRSRINSEIQIVESEFTNEQNLIIEKTYPRLTII